jgi:outer membrane protein OmpA-like peptidoglycan-associated protein
MRVAMVAVLLCAAGTARADGLDAERFVPGVGTEPGFSVEHPMVPGHLGWGLGLFFDVADDPVVVRQDDEVTSRVVDTAATLDLLGSVGFFGWSELGVHLPIQVIYSGDDGSPASEGVGDLRLVPKVLALRSGDAASHFMLGFGLPITLPTGDGPELRGADGVTVEPRVLAAWHTGALGFTGNLGYRWRSEHPAGLPWGDEIALGFAASYQVSDPLILQAELFGGKQVDTDADGADFPFEILGGIIYGITESWDLHGGAGLGMTDGIGDPDFRVVVGVRFKHGVPERHGFLDRDGDEILDKDDECPDDVEDLDAFEDEDGCPEVDNDEDGIPDETDECPDLPEEEGGDGDGCPSKTFVKIVGGEMQIFGKVQFKTGSAEIDQKSDPLLDQIAVALKANPQVKHMRIEGHTDDVGDDGINQRLSEQRAGSVKKALVSRDVDEARLETVGHGESKPAAPNGTPAGRAKNRRVEFIITESN